MRFLGVKLDSKRNQEIQQKNNVVVSLLIALSQEAKLLKYEKKRQNAALHKEKQGVQICAPPELLKVINNHRS